MFEDMTFENIMEAMMKEMPDDIDTSEEVFCIMPVQNRRSAGRDIYVYGRDRKEHVCRYGGSGTPYPDWK